MKAASAFSTAVLALMLAAVGHAESLPNTQPLERSGDLSTEMVAGIGRWLERETERVAGERDRAWQAAAATEASWTTFTAARREQLRKVLGAVDVRTPGAIEEYRSASTPPSLVKDGVTMRQVRWPVFSTVTGEGVLFTSTAMPKGVAIVLPDADELPENSTRARKLATDGWTVIVPVLVDRRSNWSGSETFDRWTNQTHREWLQRPAFEMGRTMLGYEVQKVLALLDSLQAPGSPWKDAAGKASLYGAGEGGRLALLCAALDERIASTQVTGSFGPREKLFAEPLYRNVFDLLREYGDAELAALVAPRRLEIDPSPGPQINPPPAATAQRKGAAPGTITPATAAEAGAEADRARKILGPQRGGAIQLLSASAAPATTAAEPAEAVGQEFIDVRQKRTVRELERFTQVLMPAAERARTTDFWSKLKPGPDWDAAQRSLRDRLWREVIGKIEAPHLAPNPRSRLILDKEKWRGYEVTLDVFPDVFAWGWLLLPKDLKPGEKRPVIVCQHGLEGLPEDVVNEDPKARAYASYKAFAVRLVEQGYIVYAPHNPYRGMDNFRMLQRRGNAIGLSLFSFILAQHDVLTEWLAEQPFVDPQRIAFYGLSYGGKTAMRVPALIDRYCLSICSGDFNEWVYKNVSTELRASYVFSPEWEMPEWNLAFVANYAEMAMLIAPRPFMVERGHDDGVAVDEWVGYEYAKVRRGYDKLGIGERTELEWFDGPHTIHGVGTYEFLRKHLGWAGGK